MSRRGRTYHRYRSVADAPSYSRHFHRARLASELLRIDYKPFAASALLLLFRESHYSFTDPLRDLRDEGISERLDCGRVVHRVLAQGANIRILDIPNWCRPR